MLTGSSVCSRRPAKSGQEFDFKLDGVSEEIKSRAGVQRKLHSKVRGGRESYDKISSLCRLSSHFTLEASEWRFPSEQLERPILSSSTLCSPNRRRKLSDYGKSFSRWTFPLRTRDNFAEGANKVQRQSHWVVLKYFHSNSDNWWRFHPWRRAATFALSPCE